MRKMKREFIENALRESEAKYKALIEQLPAIMYTSKIDKTSKVFYISPQVNKILGFSPSECKKDPDLWKKQLYPEDKQRVLVELNSSHSSGKPFISVYRMIAKDGSIVWFRDHALIIKDKNGKLLYLQGLMTDITESRKTMQEAQARMEEQVKKRTEELYKINESLKEEISIRKWFESELIDSEEKHRHIVESSMDAIGLAQYGKMIFVNKSFCNMFDYREFELIGKSALTVIAKSDLKFVAERMKKQMKGVAVPNIYEFKGVKKDGTIISVEISSSGLFTYKGKPTILSFFKDVTEQRNAQKVIYESRELYKSLLRTSPDAIVVVDLKGNIIEVSEEAVKMSGCKKDKDLIGKSSFELIIPEDRERALLGLKKVLREGISKNIEYGLIRKNGSRFICEMSVSLIKDANGQPKSFIATIRDITERKKAELKLIEQAFILHNVSDAVIGYDRENRVTYWGPSAEHIFGYTAEEVMGKCSIDVLRPTYTEKTRKTLRNKLWDTGYLVAEVTYRHKNGQYINTEINYKLLKDIDDYVIGHVSVIRDITERKKAEKLLKESEEKYRLLFNSLPVGIGVADFKGNVMAANPTMNIIAGYSSEEWKTIKLKSIYVNFAERQKVLEMLKKKGCVRDFEVLLKRKDGTIYTALLNIDLVDMEGKQMLLTNIRDITERKKAEKLLEEKERFLASIFSSIQDGICVIDNKMNIIRVNPIMEKLYPHSIPLVGKKCYYAYHGRKMPCEICPSSKTLTTGKAAYEIVPKRDSDGKIIGWLDLYSFPLYDVVSNKLNGAIEYVRDVTDRKKAEETLRESEEKFRAIAEYSPNMIFINKKGRVVYVNKKCVEIMGYKKEEFLSSDFDFISLTPPDAREKIMQSFKKHMKGLEVNPYEYVVITKKGDRMPAILTTKLIQYEGETAILGILTDITAQKKIEEILKRDAETFKKLVEQKTEELFNTKNELATAFGYWYSCSNSSSRIKKPVRSYSPGSI